MSKRRGSEIVVEGYVKLYRRFAEWEWYKDSNTKAIFLHCLINANYEEKKWQGTTIPKGSFITSYSSLSVGTGLSVREIRTSLNKLKLTSELTIKTTNKFTLINISNWALYQSNDVVIDKQNDKQVDKQTTNKRQTNDKQTTTTKEYKEIKNIRSKEISTKNIGESQDEKMEILVIKDEIEELFDTYAFGDMELKKTLNEFRQERKERKEPLSLIAAKKLLTSLDKLAFDNRTKIEILNQSIVSRWKGVFPIKNGNINGSNIKETPEQEIVRRSLQIERMYNQ
jgi:hypothetical protein